MKNLKIAVIVTGVMLLAGCSSVSQSAQLPSEASASTQVTAYGENKSNEILMSLPSEQGFVAEVLAIEPESSYIAESMQELKVDYTPVQVRIVSGASFVGQDFWLQLNSSIGGGYDLFALEVGSQVALVMTGETFERNDARMLAPVRFLGSFDSGAGVTGLGLGDTVQMTVDQYREKFNL